MPEDRPRPDERPTLAPLLILLAIAAVLILIAQRNGKGDIGSELPYDIATTLILVAAFDVVIRRWYALANREERRLRTFETLAYAEQERLGRELTLDEVTRMFRAARKDKD